MRFADFARSLEALEETSGRIEMYRLLGELFERAAPEEIAPAAYLCEGRLLPAFEGVETGMGERNVALALAAATRCAPEDVAEASARLGDLGLVAEELIPPTRRPRLTLTEVYEGLLRLARTSGKGSTEEKQRQLASLLGRATRREARYLVRLTLGRLRLGVAAPTVIEAVARREEDSKRARARIERAYNICSDLGLVLATYFGQGMAALEKFRVRVGSTVRPMLAECLPSA
jgi:DNA ligase-1